MYIYAVTKVNSNYSLYLKMNLLDCELILNFIKKIHLIVTIKKLLVTKALKTEQLLDI